MGETRLLASNYTVGVRPHEGNFSGQWRFSLGSEFGFMALTDQDRTLSGEWRIPSIGGHGAIDGCRDGEAFVANLVRSPLTRWHVDAAWKVGLSDLLIVGNAKLLVASDTGWVAKGAELAFFFCLAMSTFVSVFQL